jgi:hypothetical protein
MILTLLESIQTPGLTIVIVAPRLAVQDTLHKLLMNLGLTIGMKLQLGHFTVGFLIEIHCSSTAAIRKFGSNLLN